MFGDGEHQIKILKEILQEDKNLVQEVKSLVKAVLNIEDKIFPSKLTINFTHGDNFMSSVSITLQPPQPATGVASEVWKGQPYQPVPTDLTWSVQDPTIVGQVTNSDGSCTFTPLAVGSTQVGCSDKTSGLSGVATLTVTQGTGSGDSLTITLTPGPTGQSAQLKRA